MSDERPEAHNCCNCVYWRMDGSVYEKDPKDGGKEVFVGPCRFGPPSWPVVPEYQFCGAWAKSFDPGPSCDDDDYDVLKDIASQL